MLLLSTLGRVSWCAALRGKGIHASSTAGGWGHRIGRWKYTAHALGCRETAWGILLLRAAAASASASTVSLLICWHWHCRSLNIRGWGGSTTTTATSAANAATSIACIERQRRQLFQDLVLVCMEQMLLLCERLNGLIVSLG